MSETNRFKHVSKSVNEKWYVGWKPSSFSYPKEVLVLSDIIRTV